MKKQVKGFILGVVFMLVLSNIGFAGGMKKTIEIVFNSINLQVNGKIVDTDNILYNETTYVPLRKAAEMLGKEVTWNNETRTANIIDQGIPENITLVNNELIESRIDGEFTGWDGDTIFKLQNGQIWQQDSYNYTYSYKYSPKVLIYKSGIGYKMKVDGVNGEISVKRLK